ncbi:MAG: protein kinase, partial [Gammaproteobacteria bacterium]|nr:protein kinase [Gammaproteobacteria bacterium]
GGMGTVYRARDRKHGRPVAIKTIHPDLTSHLAPARFEREIHVTANLQHPHILPLLDSGVAGDLVYFIMPFVEGENLRNKLDRVGKLPPAHVVRIGRDVARALEYAHRRGVVHRDI